MTSKRDSLYPPPPPSIGRPSIARTPSREALAVHPLLGDSNGAKYIPYTPRQRPATIGPSVQPSPGHPAATATAPAPAKPPLAGLRAAAQAIGLEGNSIGWAILEKISFEGDTSDDWTDVWNALTKAKAALFLPTEPCSAHDAITPDLVLDHLVFCDVASRDDTPVVSLSGLRGHLAHDSLTVRSSLHRNTRHFQALLASSSSSRVAALDALPPLPAHPPQSYPSFAVAAFAPALPLPARATKPPLPPRPAIRGVSAPSAARLPLPFASLFGQRPSTPPPPPPPAPTPPPITPAPTTSCAPALTDADPTIDIPAFVIDTALNRTDIATGIISALKSEIAVALADQPPWLVERVHAFALAFFPFVKLPAGKKKLQDIGGNTNRVAYAVNAALDKPEELADRFQTFYAAVEAELRRGHRKDATYVDPQEPNEETVGEEDESRIRDVLENIESTLCTLLYDRLFLPSNSDDASHNEALSSRVAALNMLDLGLEHLDIDIGDANQTEVDAVIRTCGQTLAQLDHTARSPREKVAMLVSAHKLVVEGLSKIPSIRLKSRDDESKHPARLSDSTELVASPQQEMPSPSAPTVLPSTSPSQQSTINLPPPNTSPVSGDVLLPIFIFSVVKSNPARLVSHLLFIQRFRNQSFGGEESYCLINLMAVSEFLENVDLAALGLGETEKKIFSTADLTPISIAITQPPITSAPAAITTGAAFPADDNNLASLRGRVGQGVDAFAGSANKVISGVVDSSFGVLRAFLPAQTPPIATVGGNGRGAGMVGTGVGMGGETDAAPRGVRPSFGLLRRDTGFSIAGLTAAMPGAGGGSGGSGGMGMGASSSGRTRSQSQYEDIGQQRELVEVTSTSRPALLRSRSAGYAVDGYYGNNEDAEDEVKNERAEGGRRDEEGENGTANVELGNGDDDDDSQEEEEEEEEKGEEGEEEEEGEESVHDARSIKSFESMLSGGRTRRRRSTGSQGRSAALSPPSSGSGATGSGNALASTSTSTKGRRRLTDLTDRLTHGVAGMSRRVVQGTSVTSGDGQKVATLFARIPPPNRRFVECSEQDVRVSEVGELLREYQRLVEAVRSAGGFQE